MALNTNFNVNPYYDDFDEDKLFLRMLFKPGYAVQARELTQLQTLLQNQVGRFGNHVFKNGSLVTGGQIVYQDTTYINLSSSYADTAINVSTFEGKTIVDNVDNPTKRAEVLKVYESNATTNEPKTLIVKQIFGDAFTGSETIKTVETNPVYANTSGVGSSQTYSVDEGIFYYEGFFVRNLKQTVAISKYSNTTANVRVGFEITESIVTASEDTSLLDPAQNASNYQAPGADRFKITLTLATRSLDSTDLTKFIELAQYRESKLINETRIPLYSVLEDTLARRTYDESGNYTVKPFKLSLETSAANSAQANVILSPGKAYVYGYEFETISPTVITFDKPRTTESVVNKRITADYGAYVYANTIHGTPPIGGTSLVDLHCVSNTNILRTTAAKISNTKIGTARIKSIAYDSSTSTANANTFIYRSYLFDVKVSNVITGYVNNTVNVTTIQIANSLANWFSNVNNAYAGARFRITTGPGSNEPAKIITNYDGTNQIVTLNEPFSVAPVAANSGVAANSSASAWAIDFEFNDVRSMIVNAATPTNRPIFAIDTDERSKDSGSIYNEIAMADSSLEPLIFPLGESYIANNSITDFVYSYKKLYSGSGTGQSFDVTGKTTLTVDTGEALSSSGSLTTELENYTVIVTDPTGTGYYAGQVLPPTLYTISGTDLTVTGAGSSFKANIIATIDVSTSSQKNKTLVSAAQNVATSTGTTITNVFGNGAVTLFSTIGQVHVSANTVVKTPGTPQQLFVSDVIRINSIFDFGNTSITTANLAAATNVTNRYVLDTGQRDSHYDHASIKLKSGQTPPTGNLLVRFDHYLSTGTGYFTATSYPDYSDIPDYNSQYRSFILRDCLDFRPIRLSGTDTIRANTIVFESVPKIPVIGSNIDLDYQYYLPRIDKVILNKNRSFELLTGDPSLNPVQPKDKDGSMTLYILNHAPYLPTTEEIQVQYIDHRRYTMRDIGAIEKRVENLEYYTSLTLLEQDTLNKQDLTTRDTNGLQRFKNGILTDSFQGHSVADVTREDYVAAIDIRNNELHPSFNISSHILSVDTANSSNYVKEGTFVTLKSTAVAFIEQTKASKAVNINPFNVVNYLGKVELDPNSDVWYDINRQPDVLVNIGGDKDAWDQLLSGLSTSTQIEWGSWENVWTGVDTLTNLTLEAPGTGRRRQYSVNTAVTTTSTGQVRSGIASTLGVETITQSIGDRVVDVSIIPYMRERNVLFVGSGFKPSTTLFSFFDSENASKYIARANRFILAENNLSYNTTIGNAETVNVVNTLTSTVNTTCVVVKSSNDSVFVVSVNPRSNTALVGANLVGASTGTTVRIKGYEHFTGNANTATVSTIRLRIDATGANNERLYANTANSNTIYIVSGTGAGQERTMNAYNARTRTANLSVNWTTIPDNTSVYSIGNPKTTDAGDVAGIFFIPDGTYRVGEKRFRLIDNQTGDIGSSVTNGDAAFFAQGLLQTVEGTVISATVPSVVRSSVTDDRVVTSTSTTVTRTVVGYVDPLAQTFLISPTQYPDGVHINKLRVCFKSKDDVIPVTLQLRPTVNGYPSSSVVYPRGTVTLTPDKVQTTEIPNFTDNTKYTEFVFDSPVYMQPGEHSFVLLANSNKYEMFVAEKDAVDLATGEKISEQPYGGSFFLSQNGSVWEPDQNIDMMFQIYKNNFDPFGTVYMNVNVPSSNVVYDLAHLITGDLVTSNTGITYSFRAEKNGGGFADYKNIVPLTDYHMNDGAGRRVINPATGNVSFILKATMTSQSADVSPVIDTSRLGLLAIENIINDLPLTNDTIIIANTGSGMRDGIYTLDLSSDYGSGATVRANVVSGFISRAWVENGGSGYATTPTINLFASAAFSAGGYAGNMVVGSSANGASILINGEDKKVGGNGKARYITRQVTLADNFESGDLRVYLTGYRPSGTSIRVYYKVLSSADTDTFENKEYQLMTELGNENFVSVNEQDLREFTFAPGILNQANNSVSYTSGSSSYDKFKTFSIKVVFTGTDPTNVPWIRDFRAVALPRG
jgi:hypothetical protein